MSQTRECPPKRLTAYSSLKCVRPFCFEARQNKLQIRGEGRSLKDFYGLQVEIPVRRLPVLNFGFILSSFSFMISSYFYLRRKKDAIIYTIDMDNFSFVFLRFLGLPYFSEIHGAKKKAFFWEVFLKKISGSIVINNNIKKSLMGTFGLASKKIMVKPNGIDLEMFSGTITKEEARKKLDLPPDKKIAIYVGREVSWKGMGILLEAQKFLTDETIYIISDRPYQEIPYWLRAADLCIVIGTKKNEYSYLHTSPMKLFEYMASGRPILAADTPANREIVSENEAYFYEPDDPKDLADKISKIIFGVYEKDMTDFWAQKIWAINGFVRENILGDKKALDVGCGPRKLPGATGMDIAKVPGVDDVKDAKKTPC